MLCSAVEHPSVLACVGELARRGHETGFCRWTGRGVSIRKRADRRAGAGFCDGGQQRGGDGSAGCRTGEALPGAGRAVPYRCGAVAFYGCVDVREWASIWQACRGTSCMGRWASARSMSGRAWRPANAVRRRAAGRPAAGDFADGSVRRAGCRMPDRCVSWRGCRCGAAAGLAGTVVRGAGCGVPGLRRNSPDGRRAGGVSSCHRAGLDAADRLLDLPELALSTGRRAAAGRAGRPCAACHGQVGGGCVRQHPARSWAVHDPR